MANDFISTLSERGFVHQCTNLEDVMVLSRAGSAVPYVGFDLTADSLHVGSLMQIMTLHWAAHFGCRPTALLGGFTTRVGDPSGRKDSRQLLGREIVEQNRIGIQDVLDRLLKIDTADSRGVAVVNNDEWMSEMTILQLLLEFMPLFSVNKMLAMDSVKSRIDDQNHMNLLEFNYSLFQAIDFCELNSVAGCNLQIGGSDQWSNIIAGVDLIRRKSGRMAYGLTTPLMTNMAGEKMGKTAAGAIWLTASKTPVFDFWQFWRNVEDGKVEQFLSLFTTLPMEDVRRLGRLQGSDINQAKIALANAVTEFVHGVRAAKKAEATALAAFVDGAFDAIPLTIIAERFRQLQLSHFIADVAKISRAQAGRLITQNAVKIDGVIVETDQTNQELFIKDFCRLDIGKKNVRRVTTDWKTV